MYRKIELVAMHIATVFAIGLAFLIAMGFIGTPAKAHGTGQVCHSHDGKTVHCHKGK